MSNIYESVNGNEQHYEYSAGAPVEVDGDCEDLFSFVLEREQMAGLTNGNQKMEHFNGSKILSNKKNSLLHLVMLAIVISAVIVFIYMAFSSCNHSNNVRPSYQLLSPEMGHDFRAVFVH